MAGDYRVDTLAVPETINLLHDLLARVRAEHPDVQSTDLMLFETAVIEIANNVVEHGMPPGTIKYSFTLEVEPDRLSRHPRGRTERRPNLFQRHPMLSSPSRCHRM